MKYARIENDVAKDVVRVDPRNIFNEHYASQFVEVPEAVVIGSQLVDGVWINPVSETAPEEPAAAIVGPVEFKLLFTSAERIAITSARKDDPVIDDFFVIVEDPRLSFVDLGLQSTRSAISYLAEQGLIGTERVGQILAGTLQ